MRLGAYPAKLKDNTKTKALYSNSEEIPSLEHINLNT